MGAAHWHDVPVPVKATIIDLDMRADFRKAIAGHHRAQKAATTGRVLPMLDPISTPAFVGRSARNILHGIVSIAVGCHGLNLPGVDMTINLIIIDVQPSIGETQ